MATIKTSLDRNETRYEKITNVLIWHTPTQRTKINVGRLVKHCAVQTFV